jgi:sugar lactone lactonase YvrE
MRLAASSLRVVAGPLLGAACFLLDPLVAPPAVAQGTWTIAEELRIGSEDAEQYSFSDVRGIAVGSGGRILVLDFRVQEIRLFDATGKFVKLIARRGHGPGEIQQANGMIQAPDGTIWVNDPANARFSVFRPDGSFMGQHTIPIAGYGYLWGATIDTGGRVYDPISVPDGKGGYTSRFRRFAATGAVLDTIASPTCAPTSSATRRSVWRAESKTGASMGMTVPFMPSVQAAADPRGFVWCTPSAAYHVVRIRLERGDTVAVIDRKVSGPPVTAAERQAAIRRADSVFKRYDRVDADYSLIPKVKPVIAALDVDDGGRLWVRRTTSDATSTAFDVFDETGKLLATARAPFRMSNHWHPVIRGDVMYTVVLDADDVPNVVRARIRR